MTDRIEELLEQLVKANGQSNALGRKVITWEQLVTSVVLLMIGLIVYVYLSGLNITRDSIQINAENIKENTRLIAQVTAELSTTTQNLRDTTLNLKHISNQLRLNTENIKVLRPDLEPFDEKAHAQWHSSYDEVK
jgi:hypothetical protein